MSKAKQQNISEILSQSEFPLETQVFDTLTTLQLCILKLAEEFKRKKLKMGRDV